MSEAELLQSWRVETDFKKRNAILEKMTQMGLFPSGDEDKIEKEAGLYPDLPDPQSGMQDPNFLYKLLSKQEFIENRQEGIQDLFTSEDQDLASLLESDASACGAYGQEVSDTSAYVTPFELSPTQRFIGRFLSPKSPYNSALLFHGVGVGKTCSGITVAENFLEMFPKKQVVIVAPPTIQQGWLREIFNMKKLIFGTKEGMPNVHNGCTGNTYLKLSASEYERDVNIIRKRVAEVIKRRYKILGYLQFYNYVKKYLAKNISKELKGERLLQEERRFLSKKFSGTLLIVDEAHNLRDKETVFVETVKKEKVTAKPPAVDEDDVEGLLDELGAEGLEGIDSNSEEENTVPDFNQADVDRVIAELEAENAAAAEETEEEEEEDDEEEDNEEILGEIDIGEELNENENEIELTKQEGGANANDNFSADDEDNDDEIELELQEETETETEAVKEDFAGEDADAPIAPADKADIIKGKKVTPILREVLQAAEGMKFLMLTATPMYNEYREIILLMNLLLLNDKRATIRESQIFQQNGEFAPGGRELLGRIANCYVSFMRGENPLAFPVRLNPLLSESQKVRVWPSKQPDGGTISEEQRRQVINLPYVACPIPAENIPEFKALCATIISKEKLTIPSTDKLIMAGNFIYPGDKDIQQSVGKIGFQNAFLSFTKPTRFQPASNVDSEWLLDDYEGSSPLEFHSPKAHYILSKAKTTKGVCFVYSRFVESGALTLALILEANGYTCASRKAPLLEQKERIDPNGRQCALCPMKETGHVDHDFEPKNFVPAQYVLLTGEKELSPNNKEAIELATDNSNYDGRNVKIILGSTIASEGIDLKFIRELFVFDSWYHLSKLEQVIGRGIRYKSHCALPPDQRNCTINLLTLTYPESDNLETIDMYQYRNGYLKARLVGQVTRVMKEYALDCNLNKELILIKILNDKKHLMTQIDGQGNVRENVDINDTPYTNICDWLETCDYKCKPELNLDDVEIDYSTYDEYAAKWREHEIKRAFRIIFEEQPWRHFDDIQNKVLAGIPRIAKAAILQEIVGNRSFRIRVGDQEGYIIYKNGFYLFQPELLWDTNLPLALRVMSFPVKRDTYDPISIEKYEPKAKPKAAAPTVAVAVPVKEGDDLVAEEPLVNEVVDEEEEEELSQQVAFWDAIKDWSKQIADSSAGKDTPKAVNTILESRYLPLGSKTVNAIKATFEMVSRIYMKIRGNEPLRKKFSEVLLEFVWDEYLTTGEIQSLYKSNPDSGSIKIAGAENIYQFDKIKVFRYVDPTDKKIVYLCDGKPCAPSIIDGIKERDPIYNQVANKQTTGALYGLNTAKDGKILFRSNDAVNVGEKPAIGRLCYSVPNTTGHMNMLDQIGKFALTVPEIGSDLDLTKEKAAGVKTPARLCTLADLSLRLLDKVKPGKKTFFYRPVSAVITKHEGKGSK